VSPSVPHRYQIRHSTHRPRRGRPSTSIRAATTLPRTLLDLAADGGPPASRRRACARGARALYAAGTMMISTMNDLPGYEIEEVKGEVFGLTVRSRNVGSQIGASFKSLVGGELKGMTKLLAEGRDHATERLVEAAEAKGANAVIAFRFDTSELGTTWTEICAYGTAVRARQL
jgi:uncharacterized protein YbjQ (UPF0145 family)